MVDQNQVRTLMQAPFWRLLGVQVDSIVAEDHRDERKLIAKATVTLAIVAVR